MRKIKFRGKGVFDNEFHYGFYASCYEEDGTLLHYICDARDNLEIVHPDTVGQYTGIKDKNSKEIYEGDIYHMGDKNIRYVVVWNDTGLIGKQIGSRSYVGLSYWKEKIKVIGNIYENPELIKGEQ